MKSRLLMFLLGLLVAGTGWYMRDRQAVNYEPATPKAIIQVEAKEYVVLTLDLDNGKKVVFLPKSQYADYTAPAQVWQYSEDPKTNPYGYDLLSAQASQLLRGRR